MTTTSVNPTPSASPAGSAQPLLEIKDLEITFTTSNGPVKGVRSANLEVYPRETVAIVGESGSGKSTTAMAIAHLLAENGSITGGQILFEGRDITHVSEKEIRVLRGDQVGLVPQDPMSNLNPMWKVGAQIRETLAANGIAKGAEARKRTVQLLEEAGLSDAERRAEQFPHEFSGGMKQRALIAMGLAARPKLLVADEPTSALDVTVQQQILDHLDHLTGELGVAVLLITHDLGLAAERARHLVVMYKGQVVESGPALQLLQDPQHPYTKRLISAAPSLASRRLVSSSQRAEIREQAQENAPVHAEDRLTSPVPVSDTMAPEFGYAEPDTDAVIEVQSLTKSFPIRGKVPWRSTPFLAVDDVSFALRRGTTTAIVGESGSGKSTVAQMVLKLLEPTSGRVLFEGEDVADLRGGRLKALRRRVQPIFQNPYGTLDPMYSIFRTIEEPMRLHGIGDPKSREAKVRDLLDKVALPAAMMRRYPNELSGGQRQRVAIARALALDPEVVICDEAVSALDVLVQAQVLELLNDLQAELGLSYLFITHDLAVVRQIADHTLVMEKGKVVEQGTTDDVFHAPQQDYTKRLLAAIPGGSIPLAGSETIDVEAPEGLADETGGEGDGGPDDIIDPFAQAGHV
ncbi:MULTISPECIES: dipeptide ABC transporter ATP-binding protein [Brachybacterium]|uniref:ABC transporter ATP-binding protein n=2 Tax=Brachybacterium TaxID=43668 RepID=A0A3R8QW25_9MICO|nr:MULTISPECIES: ABC transporter ATP-binding protein [Brachybacterium]RRR20083.1 ABC transporter ATP-binding protein [Brachybacterium paraconglomeratum]GLI31939.1 ABC transporter ATP-binding protein [Brachybacterium conglomeratum]GLK03472.1 ABC transporter ATP-binding protein [Brachybacterium conglomeratum]